MKRSVAYTCFRLLLILALPICAAFAQRDLGTLVGTVTDPSGGIVVNAQVTITEESTGLVYQLTTNTAGEFVRPALKPSTYTVAVSAAGFRKSEQKGVVLNSGERTAINITLTVGDVGTTVEVAGQGAILQTESTQVGATLNTKTLTDVPLGGQRNATYLARLSPGVVPAENGARNANNGGFAANGVRSNGQNNFLLNGVDNNINTIDFLNQTSYAVGPSIEAIGEINVITNGYNAEYGRAAGGVFNVNLKSGTNQLHGSVFELMQNKVLDANTWNNNLAGSPRGPFVQNQFGATAGGAIKKNTLFVFGDYQGTRIATSGGSVAGLGRSGFLTIPTDAFKKGDFSSLLGPTLSVPDINGNTVNVQKGGIYDPMSTVYATAATATAAAPIGTPLTRNIFPGNIIPASRFDPAFAKILSQYPATNQAIITGTQPARDFYYVSSGGQITDQADARVDYRLSDKDSLFGSLSWGNTSKTSGAPFPGPLDGADFNGASEIDLNRNGQISYTRVWKPTLVSETRVSFTRLVTSRLGANPTTDLFSQFGIGGYNPTTATTNNGGLPQISFNYGGTNNVYQQTGANDWIPTKEFNNVWDFIQNVALSKGSHAFKFGAEYRPIKFPFFQVPDPHGNIAYNGNQTAFPAQNTQTGDAIASALLGQIDSGNISTTNFISSQKSAWGFYAQDDWKITRKLTLNLGVRYELWSPIDERFARQANFDLDTLTLFIPKGPNQDAPLPPNFATAFPTVKVLRGTVPSTLVPWDKTDIAPRFGLAYQALEKTVVRLGYGIFYGGEENQGGSPNRGEGVPFNETVNLQRTSGVSSFIGVSDPNCPGCNYFPGGLTSGYPTNVFTLPAPVSFRGVQKDFRNPLVHKWNFIVQRELPGNMSLELGYVGNHQARQLILWNSDPCPNLGTTNTSTFSCDNTRIVQGPPGTAIIGSGLSTTSTFGYGNYHAFTAKVEKRYSNGLYLLSSYTYGHVLANSGTPLSGATNFGTPNPLNFASAYSSAAWDIRHNFTTAFNYDLPVGTGKKFLGSTSRAVNTVIGNWSVNGILTLRTGQPYTISGTNCLGNWGKCMPDFVGSSPNLAPSSGRSPGTNGQWFDITGYTVAAPLTGGSLGLQSNTGPPTRTLDFSIFKDFRLTERFRVQFRSEFYNIANTPQFSTPDANLSDAKIPAGANGSAAVNGNGNFGKVLGANVGTERHIQFSLRLQF
jgi:Carboxypeptidase regulatory-like domain